jgi:hypothetical protein
MFHPPNREIDLNIDFLPDMCIYGILSSYWLPAYWFFQKSAEQQTAEIEILLKAPTLLSLKICNFF